MVYQYNYSYNSNSAFNYVKKEDAKMILRKSRYMGIIFGLVFAAMFSMFEFIIFTKLQEISVFTEISLPVYSQQNFRYTVYSIIVALCFLIQPEPEEELDRKLSQYKEGEMILVSKLMDKGYNTKMGLVFFVGFAYLVLALVLPIATMVESV